LSFLVCGLAARPVPPQTLLKGTAEQSNGRTVERPNSRTFLVLRAR
jgi:hypothetical protein